MVLVLILTILKGKYNAKKWKDDLYKIRIKLHAYYTNELKEALESKCSKKYV